MMNLTTRRLSAGICACLGAIFAVCIGAGEGLAQSEVPAARPVPREPASRPLVAALHVHSTLSTGTLTLDQLAQRARDLGIDAIVLAENFALRYEYGLPPLRGVFKVSRTIPSVSARSADRFLQDIAAAQARHPDILFVPGVEVAPHYYWTGSLLTDDLTMHNAQRNLLVLGLTKPEDYAALPAVGNRASYNYGPGSWGNLAPVALLVPAIWMWRRGPRRTAAGRRVLAGTLAGTTAVLLLNTWPFGSPSFSTYETDLDYRPYQALIDVARDRGGLVFWSLPEARDHSQFSIGPLGTVTVETPPHPEALLRTTHYSGFGGLYQDTRRITEPGAEWDQALTEHLAGDRAWPVAVGEIAFHTPGQGKIHLHQVLNVLQVRDWSPRGVLEALRHGRLYTVGQFPPAGVALRLDEFSIERLTDGRRAQAGDTMRLPEPAVLKVHVRVTARDAEAVPFSLKVIRDGRVVGATTSSTPLSFMHFDEIENPVTPTFYRVEVKGRYAEILSNPIFLRPGGDRGSEGDERAAAQGIL